MVIKSFAGDPHTCIGEEVYALEVLPSHELSSKAFDPVMLPSAPKKKYIPPMNHPWRSTSFEKYAKKQSHMQKIA